MLTDLEYNGVLLKNVHTLDFDQTPVRDPSGTDIWYWEFTIRVATTIYDEVYIDADRLHGADIKDRASTESRTLGQRCIELREKLQKDRGELEYRMSGVPVVSSNSIIDQNNGPKVSNLRISRVSPKLVHLEFEVKAAIGCQVSNFRVANNRWSCTDDMDTNFRTTRTWNGRLRISRLSISSESITPHDFRGIAVPPLASGFRRKSMQFRGEPNGLELDYTIVDEEISGGAPPYPATRMNGMHTETVGIDATQSIGEFRLRLEAPKIVAKGELITLAVTMGNQKLRVSAGNGTRHQMLQMAITDVISDEVTAIEIHMRVRHIGLQGERLGGAVIAKIGEPFELTGETGYDPNSVELVVDSPFGTAALAKNFACYLQTPCDTNNHPIDAGPRADEQQITLSAEDNGGGKITFQAVRQLPEFTTPEFSESHETAIYEHYTIDAIYNRIEQRVALPKAANGTTLPASAPTVSLVKLGRPSTRLTVRIAGERIGEWPALPKNEDFKSVEADGEIQHWVMKYIANLRPPRLMPDGVNYLHTVDAEIVYQLERPPKDEEFKTGNLPWDGHAASVSTFNSDSFTNPRDYFL